MKKRAGKEGQAMIEFMLGMVSIVILLLGINQIASIVYYDFTTIYSAREDVADKLMNGSAGTSGGGGTYDFGSLDEEFNQAINPNAELQDQLTGFPGDRVNQFDFLWENNDPLQDLTGSQIGATIPVTSRLFQRILGRSSVSINNAVYMPPWEDLLNTDQAVD